MYLCKNFITMKNYSQLVDLLEEYNLIGIADQVDYSKFYLYSLITHSTAIEGSTVTELENQLLFDEGIAAPNRPMAEQLMNMDLKAAYEESFRLAQAHTDFDIAVLQRLSALVMKNTGSIYHTALGDFDSSKGELRLLNVSAGIGGPSYLSYQKVPTRLAEFCTWLNEQRHRLPAGAVDNIYQLSFEAHYHLVSIHPWVDGNGRMARLVMNQIQMEFGVLPSKVLKEHKINYIKSLQESRENDDINIFCQFMLEEHISNVKAEIENYKKSIDGDVVINRRQFNANVVINEREAQVLEILRNEESVSAAKLAERLSMSSRQAQRILASLKQKGVICHEGSNKSGSWIIEND